MTKCPHCGGEINPASLLGKGKKKTLSPAALAARKANAQKAGRKPKSNVSNVKDQAPE
jgi:hypothetical protein